MAIRPRRRTRPVAEAASVSEPSQSRADQDVAGEINEATQDRIDAAIETSIQTGEPIHPAVAADDDDYDSIVNGTRGMIQARMDDLVQNRTQQKEYRLRLLHRMLIRQLPKDLIAKSLDVTVRHVDRLREELFTQLRTEAQNRDLATYVGFTDGFYGEIIGMSMRMATEKNIPHLRKLGAMKVAMQAKRDQIDFYEKSGFFSAMRLTPVADADDHRTREADRLIDMSQNILDVFEMTDEEYENRQPAKPKARDVFAKRHGRVEEDDEETPVRVLG